jgi:cytochrome c peroxidase
MDRRVSDKNKVIFDTKNVVGSQGVVSEKFLNIQEGNPVDDGETTFHPIFNIDGTNVRQVTGRNAPTTINAIFFDRSFWDGRANRYFNGVNPFGDLDPNARVLVAKTTKKETTTVTRYKWVLKWRGWWAYWSFEPVTKTRVDEVKTLEPVRVLIDNGALASQAVGPPNNSVEMSWDGRRFRELARKMFSLKPLALQTVHHDDSVLGEYVDEYCDHGLSSSHDYPSMIRKAFRSEWWSAKTPTSAGYTQMEANFSLFWGLSIQMYESTLVSDDTPFDRWQNGDEEALSSTAKRGLNLFLNEGKCINCHGGPEFAGATVSQLRGVLSDDGPIEFMAMQKGNAFYDGGFYNIGVRQTEEDIALGASHPVFGPLSYSRQSQNGRIVGSGLTVKPEARVAVDGAFKTPTLRNVELTGPYFHNGGQKDLLGVVKFYVRGADFKKENTNDLDPDVDGISELEGDEEGQMALVEFLRHLTDERVKFRMAPFDHPELVIPNGHSGVKKDVALDNDFILPATGRDGGDAIMPFDEVLQFGY